jgi:succinoglycan biosynthesis transport protein ExoP
VSPVLIGILGAFLGGMVGLGTVAILEFMDTRLRKGDDVESLLDTRQLATIPLPATQGAQGLHAVTHPDSEATASLRMLRAHLAGHIAQNDKFVVVFTSSKGEAPVSEVVGNLGVLMAQSGLRTLVIDAQVRQPAQNRLFRLENQTGLTTMLTEGGDFAPGRTEIQNLEVLTSGPALGNPSEAIGSARFAEVLRSAGAHADVVLVDAPALLTYSDALSAAALADGVVLVATHGASERQDLVAAVEAIEGLGLLLLGVVVTTS